MGHCSIASDDMFVDCPCLVVHSMEVLFHALFVTHDNAAVYTRSERNVRLLRQPPAVFWASVYRPTVLCCVHTVAVDCHRTGETAHLYDDTPVR